MGEASVATVDTEDMVLATPALDTLDLATLVGTDSVTEVTPVVTTASARLRLSPRLMLMLRLIPTLDTDTLVATPALDTLVDTEDMVLDTLVDMEDMVLDTLVDTDSVTEATPVVTTASARLRLSPRLMLMLMLRLIPTSDADTEDMVLDTLVDMEDMVSGTLVDTDLATEATPVVTMASARLRLSPRLMLMLRLIPTSDTDTLVATDSATEVTPVD